MEARRVHALLTHYRPPQTEGGHNHSVAQLLRKESPLPATLKAAEKGKCYA